MKSNLRTSALVSLALAGAFTAAAVTTADRYGQPVGIAYVGEPGKVTSDADLKADCEREKASLGDCRAPDPKRFDAHGGVLEEGLSLAATGFFRLQKVDGRWWFVTPEGHRFFLIGCDACGAFEGGYSTPILDLEGKPRPEFEGTELPSKDEEADAWYGKGRVNFLVANLRRKYGPDFRRISDEVTRRRLLSWGFNSTAKWGWGWKLEGVPYFEDATVRAAKVKFGGWPYGIKMSLGRYIDMYHPDLPAEVEKLAAEKTKSRKGDPDLIAYSLDNENGWNDEMLADMFAAEEGKAGSFARKAFYACVARMRGTTPDKVVAKRADAFTSAERQAFFREASAHYHRLVAGIYKKLDPDHLFIGEANSISSADGWIAGQAESPLDFIAMHEYSIESVGWYRHALRHLEKADKPFAILEYSFTSDRRGMAPYKPMTDCTSDRGRGLAYRFYTENAAVNPLCLGFGYFIMYDQPFTRRHINGESHNFGLVNQQDRPYAAMIEEVKKSNARLFALHAGTIRDPFRLDDYDGVLERPPCSVRLRNLFEPGSMGFNVECESNGRGRHMLFNGRYSHLKINHDIGLSKGVNAFGTVDLRRHGATGLTATFMCCTGGDAETWPRFEGSDDGKTFRPFEVRGERTWLGKSFNEVRYRTGTVPWRYVRIGIEVKDPTRAWLALLADVELDKSSPSSVPAAPARTHAFKTPSAMELLRPGEVRPRGWLRDQCLLAKAGYISRLDEVDQAFPRAWNRDFHPRGKYLDWGDPNKGAWCTEGGAYWFEGLVRLAWELDDPGLKAYATERLTPLLERMNPNALGFVYWMDRRDPAQLDELEKANHGFIIGASGRTTRSLIAYYEATGDALALQALTWCLDDPRCYFFGNPVTLPAAGCDVWRYCGDAKLAAALEHFKANYPGMSAAKWPALRYGHAIEPETIHFRPRNDRDKNENWEWRLQHGVLAYESLYSFLKLAQWSGDRTLLGDVIGWADWLEKNTRQVHGVTVADEQYGGPGEDRGTETCTVAGDLLLNATLAGVTGEGRFGDHVERAFFNAGAACVSRDWMHHVYFQSPNRTTGVGKFFAGPGGKGGLYKRKHWPLCCTAALARILPGYVQWMWMRPADGGIAAVLYGPNALETEIAGAAVRIDVDTSYPFDETVALTVDPAKPVRFPLRLRIPAWCENPEIGLNGETPLAIRTPVRSGFAILDREWRAGDRVTLRLPMKPTVTRVRDVNQGGKPTCSIGLGPLLFAYAIPSTDENTPKPGAKSSWTLDSGKVLASSKVTRKPMPGTWSWQEDAPVKVTVKTSDGADLALVPYGCARLRVSMFPDTAWKGAYIEGDTEEKKCFYATGETMTFRLKVGGIPALPSGKWTFRWRRTGDDGKVEQGTADVPFDKPFVYRTSIDRPGYVRLFAEVEGAGPNVKFDGGAGAAFDRIVQDRGEPEDFDAFWTREMDALAAVPIAPQLTEVDSPRPDVKLCRFSLGCTHGKPSTGFISIPRKPGKFPVRLRYFGYNESWEPRATAVPAAKDMPADEIVLRVNAHGLENGREAGYYAAARRAAGTNGYGHGFDPAANAKPETCYFLGMIARGVRAAQFAKTLPEWDGKKMSTYGGSQGGAQGLWIAALEPAVTDAEVFIPWLCDLRGKAFGGRLGADWGPEYAPGLDYFDCVNFAKRFRPEKRVNIFHAGLGDYVCPPSGVTALYHALPCEKRIHWVQNAEHGWTSPAKGKRTADF